MRISFDMQAFQSVNKIGGIGRYNYEFLKNLFQNYPDNEYTLFYNGSYQDRIIEFDRFIDTRYRVIRYLPGNDLNPFNKWIQLFNYKVAQSDILHILSPFESHQHAVIVNKKLPTKTIVTIYDFIPFLYKDLYLNSVGTEQLYKERLEILYTADMILSISEATRMDAINLFDLSPERVINIGLAVSDEYHKIGDLNSEKVMTTQKKYGIKGKFILTVSNLDHRKNLVTLIRAYSSLPDVILNEYPLVVVTNSTYDYIKQNKELTEAITENKNARINFLYSIPNEDLCVFYNLCCLFVYASLYEGGGLPVIEAMKCGAPVIASNSSSIPEYVGRKDNLFDPHESDAIATSMLNTLTNDTFREEVGRYGLEFSQNFTWLSLVQKAMAAYLQVLN